MSKCNQYVSQAWNEIFPNLSGKYPNIPNDYTRALKELEFDDWEKLQNWMYVRWRQRAFSAGVPKDELDIHSETDQRMNMSNLVTKNFYAKPIF